MRRMPGNLNTFWTSSLITIAVGLAAAAPAVADDWAQYRGPNRDGKSAETGLLKQWPEGGPKLLWAVEGVGKGYSQVSVANGVIYTSGMVGTQGVLRAYDPDGKLKWSREYGPEWSKRYPGARSIPTVHDGLVYVASGVGHLACFNAGTGQRKWGENMFARYQAPQVKWGYAESLLIDGDNVIFTPCGRKGTVVAIDRKTGRHVWASKDLRQTSGFCSPILIEHGGTRMVVTLTSASVIAVSPKDGRVLWQHPYRNFRGNHPTTPVFHNGMLYVTSGYGKGAIGLKLADDGSGVKQVWSEKKQDTLHGNVVLIDGAVYGSTHRNAGGNWVCADFKTGKILWDAACVGRGGSVIYADGMLYCYGERGTLGLIRPSRQRCQVVSAFKITKGSGQHWAHPTVANGRLYIRHGNVLMCYDVKAKAVHG